MAPDPKPSPSASDALRRTLRRARRRLMARRALEAAAALLPWSAAAVAAAVATQVVLGARSPFVLPPERLALLAAAALVAPLLVGAAHAALSARLKDLPLALLLDRGLGLKERATAAIALLAQPDAEAWSARAIESFGGRDVREALPLRPLPWRAAALALAALAGAFFLPAWPLAAGSEAAPPDQQVVKVAEELAKEAEAAEEELAERDAPEEARRILDEVRKAAERAQLEAMTKEEALQELQRLDQKVQRQQEERQAADAGALQRALSSIEQASLQRESAREADSSEAKRLEEQLQQLAKECASGTSFEERDQKRMAARLRDASEALAESHPELSQKLSDLADAIEKGDMAKAAQLAQDLATSPEMQQLSADAQTAEGLEQARRMVQQAMASMGDAPTDQEMKEMREAREGEGEGQGGEGEGQGAGQREGDAPGPGMTRENVAAVATDWGVGTTSEAAPDFRISSRGRQQDRQSKETSDWREAYQALHDSTQLDGARGRNTRVSGKLGEGELVVVQGRQVSQADESASLPAVRLPPSYARAKEEALAREEVPAAYRDSVRKYFTSLDAPSSAPKDPAPQPAPKETP